MKRKICHLSLIGRAFAYGVLLVALSASLTLVRQNVVVEAAGQNAKKEVVFTRDVAPIFYKNCVACHRPDDIAPMSLLTYKDARAWAKSIREQVVSRAMPPWRANSNYGEFSNDARLSVEEIDTIRRWVDEGAKEGDPKDLPPAHEIKRIEIRNFLFQIPAGAERHRVTACYTFDRAVRALGKGKVVLFARTQEGHSWQLRSNDDGKTWSEPRFLAVSSKMTTRHLFGAEPYVTLTYSDALADKGQLHIFIPHLWRQVLHVRMSERDLLKLPTKRDLFPDQ